MSFLALPIFFAIISFVCSIFSAVWFFLFFTAWSSGPSIGLSHHWMREVLFDKSNGLFSALITPFSVCHRCSRLLFISLKDRVMAIRTPTGLIVRKSASKYSQLFIPKGSLFRDELRKPELTSLPIPWSSPLVLFLTHQSEASGKPLLVPLCLEKRNAHFRELILMLPNDPSPGC